MTIQTLNSHSIPLELVDIILNNLFEDSQWSTIASCTLVCHSWVDFARRYLFRNITIGGEGKSISGFLHLLKTTPTISSCIKHLVIKMTPNRPTVYGFYSLHSYSSPAALPPRIIFHILNKLSELRKLSLIGLILGSHEADDPPLPLGQFKLDALELRSVFTESMGVDGPHPIGQNIVDLLGTFREIKTLTLYDPFLRANRMDDDTPDSLCIPRNRPIVQHLSLGFLRPCNFCQAQLALMALTTSQLTTLSVCCTEHSDVNAVTFHLSQFGSQLTHFEFDTRKLHYDALRAQVQTPLDTSQCTNLQSLTIRIELTDLDAVADTLIWSSAISFLASAPENLPEVIIRITPRDEYSHGQFGIMRINWPRFNTVLDHFTQLRKLSFSWDDSEGGTGSYDIERRRFLEVHLPELAAEKILCID